MPTATQLKSASFSRTITMNDATRETLSRLIKERFFSYKKQDWWLEPERNELIKVALNLGLTELADEMTLFT